MEARRWDSKASVHDSLAFCNTQTMVAANPLRPTTASLIPVQPHSDFGRIMQVQQVLPSKKKKDARKGIN